MQRKTLLVALSLAVSALAVGWWWTQARTLAVAPMAQETAATPTSATAQAAAETNGTLPPGAPATTPGAPPAPSSAPAATPPGDSTSPAAAVPLRDEIADLDRRAREGDTAAACRLGAELLNCERARRLHPYSSNVELQARVLAQRDPRGQDMDRQIDATLQDQDEDAGALVHCEGVDATRWMAPARYFHLAAQAGHRPSMLQFLRPEGWGIENVFRDPELVPLFRADAPRYFLQLLQDGDPALLRHWSATALTSQDILPGLLPPPYNEPGFASAMRQYLMAARGSAMPPMPFPVPHPPTPEQLAEAERVYARYFTSREDFAARQAQSDELATRRAVASMASHYDLEKYGCDEAPIAAPL